MTLHRPISSTATPLDFMTKHAYPWAATLKDRADMQNITTPSITRFVELLSQSTEDEDIHAMQQLVEGLPAPRQMHAGRKFCKSGVICAYKSLLASFHEEAH